MLYQVELENFYSVRDSLVIDLRARKNVDDPMGLLAPIYPGAEDSAPSIVALFGANASGKTNILRAIPFALWFATHSFHQQPSGSLPYLKFQDSESLTAPTRLSFTFDGPVTFSDWSSKTPRCPYRYEVSFSDRARFPEDIVLLEKLSYQPKGKGKFTTLFERNADPTVKTAKGFLKDSVKRPLEDILRPNASVISTLAALNHEFSRAFIASLSGIMTNIGFGQIIENSVPDVVRWYASNPDEFDRLRRFARRIDLGINDVFIDDKDPNDRRLMFRHAGLTLPLSIERESHGTQKIVKVLPFLFHTLRLGSTVIMDELDTMIHPALLPEILGWFHDREFNKYGAQLWMSCHSPSAMTMLSKEGLLLCEKSGDGNTSAYTLAEIKDVRRDENFPAKYLSGEYGALPVIG